MWFMNVCVKITIELWSILIFHYQIVLRSFWQYLVYSTFTFFRLNVQNSKKKFVLRYLVWFFRWGWIIWLTIWEKKTFKSTYLLVFHKHLYSGLLLVHLLIYIIQNLNKRQVKQGRWVLLNSQKKWCLVNTHKGWGKVMIFPILSYYLRLRKKNVSLMQDHCSI